MPAPLSSMQPGEAWIWGDYVLTLQVFPKTIADVLHQLTNSAQTFKAPIDYPFAVSTYYRKAPNPDVTSVRPILVACLEKMNIAAAAAMLKAQGINSSEFPSDKGTPYVLGVFTSASRFNLGNYQGPDDVDSVRKCLFEIIEERLQPVGEPVMIGPIASIHGHPNTGWPSLPKGRKAGCLGIVTLAVMMLVACFCFVAVHASANPSNNGPIARKG